MIMSWYQQFFDTDTVNRKLNSTKEDTSVISIDKDIKYRCSAPVFFYAQKWKNYTLDA